LGKRHLFETTPGAQGKLPTKKPNFASGKLGGGKWGRGNPELTRHESSPPKWEQYVHPPKKPSHKWGGLGKRTN